MKRKIDQEFHLRNNINDDVPIIRIPPLEITYYSAALKKRQNNIKKQKIKYKQWEKIRKKKQPQNHIKATKAAEESQKKQKNKQIKQTSTFKNAGFTIKPEPIEIKLESTLELKKINPLIVPPPALNFSSSTASVLNFLTIQQPFAESIKINPIISPSPLDFSPGLNSMIIQDDIVPIHKIFNQLAATNQLAPRINTINLIDETKKVEVKAKQIR